MSEIADRSADRTSPPRMGSSYPRPLRRGAVLMSEQGPRGPLLLPRRQKKSFIEEFNRVYASIGLRLEWQDRRREQAQREREKG